jgi:hypothetical protein
MKTHDPELERFKRTLDLVEYAQKTGYEPRPHDGAPGLTVLDHPHRDRIVIARSPHGPWIYATVADYEPRAPGESAEHALSRLRHCIDRATDKGSIVEFVASRDAAAVSLERVRERLRAYGETGRVLDLDGARDGLAHERSRASRGATPNDERVAPAERTVVRPHPELNRRRYDWTPPAAGAPRETEVERRLRRWREAQETLDRPRSATPQVPGRDTPPASPRALTRAANPSVPPPGPPSTDRSAGLGRSDKPEPARRRYDWTPAPAGMDAIAPKPRPRSPDRGR